MALPTPSLDNRRFQDLVDEAKRLIPRYCPDWTDHNVSDPGVALIELFAWMTEMLLYRVNQVPDKMYVSFLEMLGVKLEPPRSARAPITFYLSAPQPATVTIPAGTEAATVRTETSPAVVFSTEADLTIFPPNVIGAFTRNVRQADSAGWTTHALADLDLPNRSVVMFPNPPSPGDAFYLAFDQDLGRHVLALVLKCRAAGGEGIDPRNPPLVWEAWQGGVARWAPCEIELDSTGGFNYPDGEVVLHIPAMTRETLQGVSAFWLRCRLTDAQGGVQAYRASPELLRLQVEARGGTADARHATTTCLELLGHSDGSPGQTFQFLNLPVLARDPVRDRLIIEPPGEPAQTWEEVPDFASSGPQDRHYTIDPVFGTLSLGPSLVQPDGSMYHFGAVPRRGSALRFSRYQSGGGVTGNVPRGTITVLKTSIPYVARVFNRQRAEGGLDAQTLEDAKLRAPQLMRNTRRAVTAEDFELLACQVPGVARALCVGPGALPGDPSAPKPGTIHLHVVPDSGRPEGQIPAEHLALSAELRSKVQSYLEHRRTLGSILEVRQPAYVWVSVVARIQATRRLDAAMAADLQARAEAALFRYLNPYVGGPHGTGWPFGRDLHVSELFALLQRIELVEFVEAVQVGVVEPGSTTPKAAPARLTVPKGALICSNQHRVMVVS